MQTYTIPEAQWIEFFDEFSREHAGWKTSIEVLDKSIGPQHVAENLPLQGISFDSKGSRPCTIQISAGGPSAKHVSNVVDMPLYIRQVEEPNGDVDVQIEPASGPMTLLHLQKPTQ